MYTALKHTHSSLAYLFLGLMLITLFVILFRYTQKKSFTEGVRKLSLFTLIATHLQLVLGLLLYFGFSPIGFANLSGEAMKDSYSRLMALEHPLMMIVGVVLITIGYSRAKRAIEPGKKYRTLLIFYALGLLLILSRIPWQIWPSSM
jgi:heme A synthase